MGRSLGPLATLTILLGTATLAGAEGPPRPLILAHVMPWFESKPVSGAWGWHWTMNRSDPEKVDATGRRQIASHYDPLIGPYDSADPDVLEYHTLLMKVAGADGVIADWYGSEDFNDYAAIRRRTAALFEATKSRGLKFAVCYEDRVLKAMAERDKWTPEQAVEHGKAHLRFCEGRWFREPSYVTWDGKPLLLVFGPDYLKPAQWDAVLSGLQPAPAFFTLHERRPPAIGSFAWPPMWASKDGKLDPKDLDAYFDRVAKQDGLKIGCAFPGFRDFYAQAGVQPSYGDLDPRDGATFRHTLGRAIASGAPVIQLATWNDFGEGTMIEPTRENGYRDLETLQDARRRSPGPPFPYRPSDLRLPLRIFELRKSLAPSAPGRKALDEAAGRLLAADCAAASRRLDDLGGPAGRAPAPAK